MPWIWLGSFIFSGGIPATGKFDLEANCGGGGGGKFDPRFLGAWWGETYLFASFGLGGANKLFLFDDEGTICGTCDIVCGWIGDGDNCRLWGRGEVEWC